MKNLSKSLNEYSGSIYSQFGEDGIKNRLIIKFFFVKM